MSAFRILAAASWLAILGGCDTPHREEHIAPAPYSEARTVIVEQLHSSLTPSDIHAIYLGDSITAGWDLHAPIPGDRHNRSRYEWNLGVDGDRIGTLLTRMEDDRLSLVQPRLVVLLIGTNDIADRRYTTRAIAEGVLSVASRAHERWSEASILVLGLLPRRDNLDGDIIECNAMLGAMVWPPRTQYLDASPAFRKPTGQPMGTMFRDDVHLTEVGYAALETQIASFLVTAESDSQ